MRNGEGVTQDGGRALPPDLRPGIARLVEFGELPVEVGQLEPSGEDGVDVIEELIVGGSRNGRRIRGRSP
jgi:hypothetical protein